jgi:ABC-type glycerol-3-phosphate transport system substrate-binding protein
MISPKFSRRTVLASCVAAAAASLLEACSSATPAAPTPAPPPTSKPAAASAAATVAPAAQPAASKQVTNLRLAHWWGTMISPVMNILEGKYNVKITEESASFNEFADKLMTQYAGGVGPDITWMDPNFWGRFFVANLFRPLDDALKTSGLDSSKWAFDVTKECTYKGKVQGLPLFEPHGVVWAVNTDLIDKMGVKVPNPWPFWGTPEFDNFSWDKLVENFQATTKRNSDGTVEIYGDSNTYSGWSPWIMMDIYELGGKVFDSEEFDEKQTFVNSPEAVTAIQRRLDLMLKHKVSPPLGASQAYKEGIWQAQKGVSNESWNSYNIYGTPEQRGYKWRWVNQPHAGNTRVIMKIWNSSHVNAKSASLDAATQVAIAAATDYDFDASMFKLTLNPPAYDTTKHLATVTDPHKVEAMKVYHARYASLSECKSCTEGVKFVSQHLGRNGGFFTKTVGDAIQSVITGKSQLQPALDAAKKAIDAELAKV